MRQFVKDASAITERWYKRRQRDADDRRDPPNSQFKRDAYRLIRSYIDAGKERVFEDVAAADGRPKRLVTQARSNLFKLGLVAMFADEGMLSDSDRNVYSKQMLYAYQHDVPPQLLVAFIGFAGSPARIAAKLASGEREPGFEFIDPPRQL
ncbi:hypothetical protein [Sphingomonas sp.]|uniref:hypothetical protein n=1 Tax=Sphingomonas sp. TaxID=28214 RepID=UPI001EB80295|nr:hypothetical protein [Sphingomonas sp.]MBX3595767.1 hypothetical protein [Sphingomonas sp.]